MLPFSMIHAAADADTLISLPLLMLRRHACAALRRYAAVCYDAMLMFTLSLRLLHIATPSCLRFRRRHFHVADTRLFR